MVSVETATVYRGGGRRWFSLKAAIKAEAQAKIRARKTACECDYCDHPEMPGAGREDLPCDLHGRLYEKALRRMIRLYTAAYKKQYNPLASASPI